MVRYWAFCAGVFFMSALVKAYTGEWFLAAVCAFSTVGFIFASWASEHLRPATPNPYATDKGD